MDSQSQEKTEKPQTTAAADIAKQFKSIIAEGQTKKHRSFADRLRFGRKFNKRKLVPDVKRRFIYNEDALDDGADLFAENLPPEEDLHEMVDWDDATMQRYVSQTLVGRLMRHIGFKIFTLILIVFNTILVTVGTDSYVLKRHYTTFSAMEKIVTMIFVCEVALKWYYDFRLFWKNFWNVFDVAILSIIILGPSLSFLASGRALRILKVVKSFRTLKSIQALTGLTIVVHTIGQSIPDMTNILMLLLVILTVLAVTGVTLFGDEVPQYFGSIGSALFSLFICVTQDGWLDIITAFKETTNTALYYGGSAYLLFAILLGGFIFANLIVAVVVTNLEFAMKTMNEERRAMTDVLDTERGPVGLEEDHVPIISANRANYNADVTRQHPLELADFSHLTVEKLQHYFLILTAIEENIAEYKTIRKDLDQIAGVIKTFNMMDGQIDMTKAGDMANQVLKAIESVDLETGDIMSNLIKLEDKKALDSTRAQTITELKLV